MPTAPPPASPDPRRRPSVVVLRAGDPGDPVLHVVHTLDGHVGALRPLASAVGPGVAVRGLASPLVAR
ncbi:MAG: hypothetical protein H6518_15915, partial [Microthrixaceae bacterium]|nr:hypothetical protein [Microthrixaceae bacterium]